MKSFKQYLAESVKESHYVVKLAMHPSDEQLDALEACLKKYDLIDISKPRMIEKDTIDFSNYPDKKVHAIAFTTGMPVSSYMLMQQLRNALNVAEDFIVVRGSNEPIEIEAEDQEFNGTAYDPDRQPGAARLSTDRFYDDAEQPLVTDVFGDDYNRKLMDYLAKVADDRETDHYEAPAPLFSWIDMDKAMAANEVQADDFNDRFDTVKPVSKGKGKDVNPIDPKYLGKGGNFDDAAATVVKFARNKKGEREAVSAPRARLKAEKVR